MMTKPKKTERRKQTKSVVSANAGVLVTDHISAESESAGEQIHNDHCAPAGTTTVPAANPEAERLQQPECQLHSLHPDADFDMAVRELAYFKWEAAGFPAGDGFDFWLQAEQEIHAMRPPSTPDSE